MSSKCSSFGSVVKLPQGHHNFVVVFLHGWLGQKVRTMNPLMEEVALESALARESYRFRLDVIKLCQTHSIAAKYCSFPVVYDFIPRSYVSNFVDKHKITQVNTRRIPVCGSTQPSVFAILQRSSCSFCRKGTFGTQATAEYADHVKHDVGARKIGRLFAGISRRRNGSVLENLRTSGPSTPEDTWRDLYGYDMHSWQSMSINLCPKLK